MNHVEQTNKRIYAQYRDKPKITSWLRSLATAANEIESALLAVASSYDIDAATSEQLDVIGRIVGVSRYFESGALDNDTYRLIIKSKIVKNTSDATLDGIILALSFIVGFSDIRIVDNEDMAFSVEFYQELSALQRTVITNFDIVPKPQGVRLGKPLTAQFKKHSGCLHD